MHLIAHAHAPSLWLLRRTKCRRARNDILLVTRYITVIFLEAPANIG
jgi:hypothetical protein